MDTLGKRVKTLRKQKGLSQQALGDLAGLSQPTIRDIEKGITLQPRRLNKLAQVLGVTPQELMFGKDSYQKKLHPLLTLEEIANIDYKNLTIDNWKKWIPNDYNFREYDFGILIEEDYGGLLRKDSVMICNGTRKIKNGNTGVFLAKGAPTAIIRDYRQEGDRIYLVDMRNQFPAIDITDRLDEYQILGIYTQLIGNIND